MFKIPKWAAICISVTGMWWAEMSGATSIPLAFTALFLQGHERELFAILSFCALWVYAIKVALENHRLIEANKNELTTLKNSRDEEILKIKAELTGQIGALEKRIESLQTPTLDIKVDSSNSIPSKSHLCKILVHNQSLARNADGLKVQLVSFKDEMEVEYPQVIKEEFHPRLPMILNPVPGVAQSINPGEGLIYAAFNVQMGSKITGKVREFVATFNSPANADSFPAPSAWWVAGKKYRIKFAASAREMPRIEREFELEFFEESDKCRMNMTPII